MFYMSNDMVSGDKVLITEVTFKVTTDNANIVLILIIQVFILSVVIPNVHVQMLGALMNLEVLL